MVLMKLALALGAALTAMPLSAQMPATGAPHARVRVSDLDLTTDRGRSTLQSRLYRAVRRVCDGPDIADLDTRIAYQRCIAETTSQVEMKRAALLQGQPAAAAGNLAGR